MYLFWIKIIFYALVGFSGVLEPMKYSKSVLVVGSIAPGKINRAQKSIWIQNNLKPHFHKSWDTL